MVFLTRCLALETIRNLLSHYHRLVSRIARLDDERMEAKQRQAASSFLEHGITFTVYGDEEGSERIFLSTLFLESFL